MPIDSRRRGFQADKNIVQRLLCSLLSLLVFAHSKRIRRTDRCCSLRTWEHGEQRRPSAYCSKPLAGFSVQHLPPRCLRFSPNTPGFNCLKPSASASSLEETIFSSSLLWALPFFSFGWKDQRTGTQWWDPKCSKLVPDSAVLLEWMGRKYDRILFPLIFPTLTCPNGDYDCVQITCMRNTFHGQQLEMWPSAGELVLIY